MNLRQVSPGDPVSSIGLDGLFEGCSILQDAQFYAKGGDLDRLENPTDAIGSDTITRALNAANTPTTKTPHYGNLTKKIVSRTISVDNIVGQRVGDMVAELGKNSRTEMRQVGYRLQNMFLNGDDGAVVTDFDGFANLVDASKVLAGDLLGMIVPVGGDVVMDLQQTAVERLLSVAAFCRAFFQKRITAYMNPLLHIRWVTVAKKLGFYLPIQEIGETIDTIRGDIVLRSVGLDEDGDAFLPFTETPNGGNSSSIWLVGWGEGEGVTCLTSAGLVGEYKPGANIFGYNQYDLDMTLGVQDKNALVQSPGWKLS